MPVCSSVPKINTLFFTQLSSVHTNKFRQLKYYCFPSMHNNYNARKCTLMIASCNMFFVISHEESASFWKSLIDFYIGIIYLSQKKAHLVSLAAMIILTILFTEWYDCFAISVCS